jgi:hypothetical protein
MAPFDYFAQASRLSAAQAADARDERIQDGGDIGASMRGAISGSIPRHARGHQSKE